MSKIKKLIAKSLLILAISILQINVSVAMSCKESEPKFMKYIEKYENLPETQDLTKRTCDTIKMQMFSIWHYKNCIKGGTLSPIEKDAYQKVLKEVISSVKSLAKTHRDIHRDGKSCDTSEVSFTGLSY